MRILNYGSSFIFLLSIRNVNFCVVKTFHMKLIEKLFPGRHSLSQWGIQRHWEAARHSLSQSVGRANLWQRAGAGGVGGSEPNSCVVKCMLPTAWLNSRGAHSEGDEDNVMATCLAAATQVQAWAKAYVQQRTNCRRQSDVYFIELQLAGKCSQRSCPSSCHWQRWLVLLLTRLNCQVGLLGLLSAHQNTTQRLPLH